MATRTLSSLGFCARHGEGLFARASSPCSAGTGYSSGLSDGPLPWSGLRASESEPNGRKADARIYGSKPMTFLPIVARELRIAARRLSTYRVRSGAALVLILIGTWLFLIKQHEPT